MSNEMEDQLAKLKANYVAALPAKIDAIRTLWTTVCESKNSEGVGELHRMAHSLAGSGATFDQASVSKYAKDLENYIKDNSSDQSIFDGVHFTEVENRLQQLENSIAS